MQFLLQLIWSNHRINNYFKCEQTDSKHPGDTYTLLQHGWLLSSKINHHKIKRRNGIADLKNTVSCHHAARCMKKEKKNNVTVIPLYLLSAMLSNSSDEELCAQCSTEVLGICLPTRPGNTMKADYSAQGSLMCFIWMR